MVDDSVGWKNWVYRGFVFLFVHLFGHNSTTCHGCAMVYGDNQSYHRGVVYELVTAVITGVL